MDVNKNNATVGDDTVAVLMAVYNGERFLDRQLETIYNQTYDNIVVYVRDDKSSDKTLEILNNWKDRLNICLLESDKNIGPADSFMDLVYRCGHHKYYAFSDQDDEWDPDKLEIAINKVKQFDVPFLYFCNARIIDENSRVLKENTLVNEADLNFWSDIVCGVCAGCAMVFNDKLMELVRRTKYRSIPMHDTLFGLSAMAMGYFYYDKTVHYSRRMHSNNVVGREGKSATALFKQKLMLWFKNGKKDPIDTFLDDIALNLAKESTVVDFKELSHIIHYKENLINKIRVLTDKRLTSTNTRAVRSFKARVLLNLI